MKNVPHLLRLNMRLNKSDTGKSDYISKVFSALIYGFVISLFVIFFINLVVNFETVGAEFELLVFLLFFVLIAKVIFGMILCLKVFFNNSQNEILARMPFSTLEIFSSRLIYVFTLQLFFGFALLLPLLNIYGYLLLMPMSFYVAILFVVIFSNVVALLISTILSFPCAYIKTFLSNKFALTLFVIAAGFALGFYGYMKVLEGVVDISSSIEFRINNNIIEVISRMSALLHPNIFLSNILFLEDILSSILSLIIIVVGLTGIIFILMKFTYDKMLGRKIGEAKTYVGKKVKNERKVLFSSLLKREFVNIFRNTNFLFQYFALLIVTPIITFLSVESSSAIATGQIGQIAQKVITFLVLSIFSVIGSSFATNAISREGSGFFLLKILPLRPKSIVASKLALSIIATFISLLISVVILVLFGFIDIPNMFLILFYTFTFSIGNICFAIKMDLNKPQLQEDVGIVSSDKTSVIAITCGLFLAVLFSGFLLLGVAFDYQVLMGALIAVAITIYAISAIILLYSKIDDRFKNIII